MTEIPVLEGRMPLELSENIRHKLINGMIDYYKNYGREFPWRTVSDPYKILITEIMLRKTTAKKLMYCWFNFFEKYPSIDELRLAKEEMLEAMIFPLGLQRQRSKDLIKIAGVISDTHNSKIPDRFEDLISIHGVGPYAANATLCFAFKQITPIVDVNVARIYLRLFDIRLGNNIYADKKFLKIANYLLPKRRSQIVDFNYGLLDFGSLICRAKSPKCVECFFNKICVFKNHNR